HRLCTSRCPPSFSLHAAPRSDTYPLSLHDALPILLPADLVELRQGAVRADRHRIVDHPRFRPLDVVHLLRLVLLGQVPVDDAQTDRKSTRLNSSHVSISYAVFCLKKKNIDMTLSIT